MVAAMALPGAVHLRGVGHTSARLCMQQSLLCLEWPCMQLQSNSFSFFHCSEQCVTKRSYLLSKEQSSDVCTAAAPRDSSTPVELWQQIQEVC
jgi:hypothetical protein